MYNKVKLNLLLLTKLITILSFGCATLIKKIIPIEYCESQKEYFGMKGITLDIDVFFYKLNDSIQIIVYMTAATQCVTHVLVSLFSCCHFIQTVVID